MNVAYYWLLQVGEYTTKQQIEKSRKKKRKTNQDKEVPTQGLYVLQKRLGRKHDNVTTLGGHGTHPERVWINNVAVK
jgi:hypothetical protein